MNWSQSRSANGLILLLVTAFLTFNAPARAQSGWVGTWAASQQIPEPANALPASELTDATLRQVVHLSVGGAAVRLHLSNAFGTEPLHITAVHVARPLLRAAARIDPASDRVVHFSGAGDVTVPAGAEFVSDAVEMPVAGLSDLAITMHIERAPAQQTGHPGSRATSYIVHGNAVAAADLPDAKKVEHWYLLAGVDARSSNTASSVVVLGDSITDGHASTTNGNDRWTDVLAERLQAAPATRFVGVLNEGIGGNHLLTDGLGPNALARFDRDVLAQPGVHTLIVLEGVNDLGGLARLGEVPEGEHHALVQRIESAYEQMMMRAHAHGIQVIGATITPYSGSDYYHPQASNEADRVAVNDWIRVPGHFDAVIDFDMMMGDPQHPDRLLPAYDCGDHLHPSPAGYRAMGESISLSLLAR